MRAGHTHAAIEARDAGTRFHLALERDTQRKFMRRLGGAIGGTVLGMGGLATGDPAGFIVLASLGIVWGNLIGRGAWRMLAPRWAGRLDRLISLLSGEALRNGTPVASDARATASAATAGREGHDH